MAPTKLRILHCSYPSTVSGRRLGRREHNAGWSLGLLVVVLAVKHRDVETCSGDRGCAHGCERLSVILGGRAGARVFPSSRAGRWLPPWAPSSRLRAWPAGARSGVRGLPLAARGLRPASRFGAGCRCRTPLSGCGVMGCLVFRLPPFSARRPSLDGLVAWFCGLVPDAPDCASASNTVWTAAMEASCRSQAPRAERDCSWNREQQHQSAHRQQRQ